MGTSTPELVVTVDAALAGLAEIGVGNVVGSNAYTLAFILGAVSLLRVIPVERSLVHRDGAALVLSTFVGVGALLDRTVTAIEGAPLVGLFVAYTAYLVRDERTAHSIETPTWLTVLTVVTPTWLTVLTVVRVAALWSGRRLSRTEGALFACSVLARWTLGLSRIFG
ncbi:Na+/Ca+ antiporter, CaCA family protein [Halorubrum saccharovorum DSM 1137]|uniref:Na+/Ca+ antiporter, CaCA family protein n=2 Tax=Halorubrum saccharovorum TaxID=2248 RepID=M0E757_9EURY|nr:Na+/Ca+ antiporter, CaCA family protein [Halorubrum saccharovorum DSM 1137]